MSSLSFQKPGSPPQPAKAKENNKEGELDYEKCWYIVTIHSCGHSRALREHVETKCQDCIRNKRAVSETRGDRYRGTGQGPSRQTSLARSLRGSFGC
jgi:hypothetical protein